MSFPPLTPVPVGRVRPLAPRRHVAGGLLGCHCEKNAALVAAGGAA